MQISAQPARLGMNVIKVTVSIYVTQWDVVHVVVAGWVGGAF